MEFIKMATASGKKQPNRNVLPNVVNIPTSSTPQSTQQKTDYTPVFTQEISDIMRGYGDCEQPLAETVILVEKIVVQQMRSLLNDVISIAFERKGRAQPTQRDFEFLMRKNPTKIYRLQKHLKDLDFRRRYHDMLNGRFTAYNEEFDEQSDGEPEEVPEKYDEEKIRRLFRADRISNIMQGAQYTQYNEARRTSFHCRNSTGIRNKLKTLLSPPSDAHLSAQVYTILGYLVHETIANLVDYAILTRLDSSNRAVEPCQRIVSSGNKVFEFFF